MNFIQSRHISLKFSGDNYIGSFISVKNNLEILNNLLLTETTLSFFDTETVHKGSKFKLDILNQSVQTLEAMDVKIYGEINFEYANTKNFEIFLSVNGTSIIPGKIGTGRGIGSPLTIASIGAFHTNKDDIITIRAKSLDAPDVLHVVSCSVIIEEI